MARAYPAADYAPPRRRGRVYEDDLRGALADPGEEDPPPRRSAADDLVDSVLPASLDWQGLVRAYPLPALAVAAIGGYWLGRMRGPRILGALTAFAASSVTQAANDILGEDLFEDD
jgi:hypothetical protein